MQPNLSIVAELITLTRGLSGYCTLSAQRTALAARVRFNEP
jgi:hypothetical protein